MEEKKAIDVLTHANFLLGRSQGKTTFTVALLQAIKSLKAQTKLKEYIERINQPEYKDVVWKKDEVVLLLQELVAE